MRARWAVILVLAVLFAGCAGGNAVSTTVTTVAPTTTTTTEGPTTTTAVEPSTTTSTTTTVPDSRLAWARIPHDEAIFGGPGDQLAESVAVGGPGLVAVGYDHVVETLFRGQCG